MFAQNNPSNVNLPDDDLALGLEPGGSEDELDSTQAEARNDILLRDIGASSDMPNPKIGSIDALRLADRLEQQQLSSVPDTLGHDRRATHRLFGWWKALHDDKEGRPVAAGDVLAHLGSIDPELRNVLIIAKTSRSKKNRRVYYVGPAFEEALLSAAGDKFNVGFLLGVSSHLAQTLENPTDFSYQFCKTTDAIGRAIYFRAMAAALYRSYDGAMVWAFTGSVSLCNRNDQDFDPRAL